MRSGRQFHSAGSQPSAPLIISMAVDIISSAFSFPASGASCAAQYARTARSAFAVFVAAGVEALGPATIGSVSASATVHRAPPTESCPRAGSCSTYKTTGRPSKLTVPASGDSKPARHFIRVDLPTPLTPISPMRDPAATPREMSRNW